MGDKLRMSRKERRRLVEMALVAEGRLTLRKASERSGLSYRQMKRIWKRYQAEGAAGLVHRGRDSPSNHRKPEEFRVRCLSLYREAYEGFGPTLASEKLLDRGVEIAPETLRRWLLAEGLWKRRRKSRRHRQRRRRKEHFGELLQLDGSHHEWFGEGNWACLMVMVDDATGISEALFAEEETTEAAMRALWLWIERHGVPMAVYVDRKTVYVNERPATLEEQLADQEPLTTFGKACQRLGIEIVVAHSPQAHGRVERKNGVYQDRLVKELELLGIQDIEGGNALLQGGFTDHLNRKFGKEPASPEDFHRPLPKGLTLESVLVFEETRVVTNDWTISYKNRRFQITGPRCHLPVPRKKVTVQRRLDGSLRLIYLGRELTFHEIDLEAERSKRNTLEVRKNSSPAKATKPRADHPWRKPFSRRVLIAAARDAHARAGKPVQADQPEAKP